MVGFDDGFQVWLVELYVERGAETAVEDVPVPEPWFPGLPGHDPGRPGCDGLDGVVGGVCEIDGAAGGVIV